MIKGFLKNHTTYLVVLLACIFAGQVIFGNQGKGPAWDEPSYISGGYTYLKWGDFRLNSSHPPLTQYLIALPLLFMDLQVPDKESPSFRQAENPVVEFGYQFLHESGNDSFKILRWARLSSLLFGLLLLLAVYLWGLEMYGRIPALFAATIVTFSPALVGQAKLATEDMGCAALMFMAVWMLWRALRGRTCLGWALCGLFTGLALVSKYTALLLCPIFIVLSLGYWWRNRSMLAPLELVKGGAIVCVVSFAVIGAVYNLSFDYSLYLNGLQNIYGDMAPGFRGYLFGRSSDGAFWYYYFSAFFLKMPVPVLLLIVASGVCAFRSGAHRETAFFLLVPVVAVMLVACFDKYNLGIYRVLPSLPFLCLFAAGFAIGNKSRLEKVLIGGVVCWMVLVAWRSYPHHLTFFNVLAGGPKKGPYLLKSQDIGNGQDLPALVAWQKKKNKGRPIRLYYYGVDNPMAYGLDLQQVDEMDLVEPQPGTYAISANHLVLLRMLQAKRPGLDIDWLTKYRPIAYAGNSIYIYRFP